MSGFRKVKTSGKMYMSDQEKLREMVTSTMRKISDIVGATYGPGGRNCIIESELHNVPNKNTKDGVTVFKSLGSDDSYEHLIIEQARDAAARTCSEAGDGTTTATIVSEAIVRNLFEFCFVHKRYSPQKAMREINQVVRDVVVPFIREKSISITAENEDLLKKVATVSANGDREMADAVMDAFAKVGFSDSSHVIIQELTGPGGFEVEHVTGYPVSMGYEESAGKFHQTFITDKGNNTVVLENPKFLLFDGQITDLVRFYNIIDYFGQRYSAGDSEFRDLVLVAHGFSESVLLELSFNMADSKTLNVVPLRSPMLPMVNSQREFLDDLAAFTGAKVVDMGFNIAALAAQVQNGGEEGIRAEQELQRCFGEGMERFEMQRFRSTIVGNPEQINVEVRAEELSKRIKHAANAREKEILEERVGMLTSGIAKLKVFGASNGELKERHDRCEDAVCAVRSAVSHGVVGGGCRVLVDTATLLTDKYGPRSELYDEFLKDPSSAVGGFEPNVIASVLVPSLLEPFNRLLENVGLSEEEIEDVFSKMMEDEDVIYDAEKHEIGKYSDMGIYDAERAMEEAIKNATSIATVLGTLGGIVAFPRDHELERRESREIREFSQMVENPTQFKNEANERY